MIQHVYLLGYSPFLLEDLSWGEDFFARLRNLTSIYMTFFPQRRDSDIISRLRRHTTYPIPRTRTSTLPWLNINNLKYKQTYNTVCSVFVRVYEDLCAAVNLTEASSLDAKDWNVLFLSPPTDFYMYIVFVWFIMLNILRMYLFYLCISFSLSGYRLH